MQRHLKLIHDIIKGKPAHLRSPKWHKVEQEHLEKEPECQRCGARSARTEGKGLRTKEGQERNVKLQVHHIQPFHLHPELELDPENFITLCEEGGYLNCHFMYGHLGDWKTFNPDIRKQCEEHKKTPEMQILEAIRKCDPDLYHFMTKAKMARGLRTKD
ncbi:MAG: HNH endonuclease [Syntrophobacteraceae bacterium]